METINKSGSYIINDIIVNDDYDDCLSFESKLNMDNIYYMYKPYDRDERIKKSYNLLIVKKYLDLVKNTMSGIEKIKITYFLFSFLDDNYRFFVDQSRFRSTVRAKINEFINGRLYVQITTPEDQKYLDIFINKGIELLEKIDIIDKLDTMTLPI